MFYFNSARFKNNSVMGKLYAWDNVGKMNIFSTVNFIKSKYISSIFIENLRLQMRRAVGNRF